MIGLAVFVNEYGSIDGVVVTVIGIPLTWRYNRPSF